MSAELGYVREARESWSLIPIILRSTLAYHLISSAENCCRSRWYIAIVVIVGCCYHLKKLASAELIQFVPENSLDGLPTAKLSVKFVNLFDQGMDGARNVTTVIGPESALDLV